MQTGWNKNAVQTQGQDPVAIVTGSAAGNVTYNVKPTDRHVRGDSTLGAIILQLPAVGTMAGQKLMVTNVAGTNGITISDADDSESWTDLSDLNTALDKRILDNDGYAWNAVFSDITT